jgi:hypothetical protein
MIKSSKAVIAAGLLAIAGVSRVAAADVDDGYQAVVHAHSRAAKPTTTTQFADANMQIFLPRCVMCHDGTPGPALPAP